MHLPTKTFRKSSMCNFCSNVWIYGRCHVSVMPRKSLGRKMKKIIYKQEQSLALRPFEKKLFEKYKKGKDNKLVLKCSVCCKRTIIPLSKAVKVKPSVVQSDNVETAVKNKKKKKKKKDTYAGLNSSIVSAYTPKRELSILKREKKNNKANKLVDVSQSIEPVVTPQEQPSHSRRRKRKAGENSNDFTVFSTAGPKVQKFKSTVREQIAEAKRQIVSSRKKNKERMILELENTTKKMRKCSALRNILADASAASQSPRPKLKEFLASLN